MRAVSPTARRAARTPPTRTTTPWTPIAFCQTARVARAKSPIIRAAIKAYNAKADKYAQVVQKQGQPLREGFSIAMVRAARSLSLSGVALGRCNLVT